MTRDLATTADARALEAARRAARIAAPGYRTAARRKLRAVVHAILAREVKSAVRGRG